MMFFLKRTVSRDRKLVWCNRHTRILKPLKCSLSSNLTLKVNLSRTTHRLGEQDKQYRYCYPILYRVYRAGLFKKSMGAKNRGGIGLSYRPARLHRLAEFIHQNQFRGPKTFKNTSSECRLSFQSSELGPPPFHPQGSVAPPPLWVQRGRGRGVGTQFRRRDRHSGTLCTVHFCIRNGCNQLSPNL